MDRIVCIGGSTGAPAGLTDLLAKLPGDLPAPILVALHMPGSMTAGFAQTLEKRVSFRVCVAENGARPEPGCVYLGPGGLHLGLSPTGRIVLSPKPQELHFKPSIDILFFTAAKALGPRVVGVVLTGLSAKKDAVEGALALRKARAEVLVIDDPSSKFLGMPKAVIEAGGASRVLPARDLPTALARAVRG